MPTVTPTALTPDTLHAQLVAELEAWDRQYQLGINVNGCRLTLADDGFNLHIEHISVPDTHRQRGYGTAMLTAVCEWADRNGETLRLHMSTEYGTDLDVLTTFYGRHGFTRINRGGDMSRTPEAAIAATRNNINALTSPEEEP